SDSGSGASSIPSTRPIQVGSGSGPKSLRRRPPRRACSAIDCAATPRPRAVVVLNARMATGAMERGRNVAGTACGWRKAPEYSDGTVRIDAPFRCGCMRGRAPLGRPAIGPGSPGWTQVLRPQAAPEEGLGKPVAVQRVLAAQAVLGARIGHQFERRAARLQVAH